MDPCICDTLSTFYKVYLHMEVSSMSEDHAQLLSYRRDGTCLNVFTLQSPNAVEECHGGSLKTTTVEDSIPHGPEILPLAVSRPAASGDLVCCLGDVDEPSVNQGLSIGLRYPKGPSHDR
jgi:hypothetical protein